MRKPLPYQLPVLAWASERYRPAFFLEKRLGKCYVAINWAVQRECHRVLVVAPAQVVDTWFDELLLERQPAMHLRGYKSSPKDGLVNRFFITTYETLRGNETLQRFKWDCVILDESRVIGNPKAKITKICTRAFVNVPNRAILSGKPAPESPLEYFCQFKFLRGGFGGYTNYYNFRNEQFRPDPFGWKWTPTNGALHRIMVEVDKHAYQLSRQGAGAGSRSITQVHKVSLPEKARSIYEEAERHFIFGDRETLWKPVVYTWLQRIAGGCHADCQSNHKLNELKGLVDGDFRGEQVVIWCRFNDEIATIFSMLNVGRLQGRVGVVWGRDDNKTRWKNIQRFRSGKLNILVCQVACLKYGVDLSVSSTNIVFSLPWGSDDFDQLKDRIVHPMKTEPVLHVILSTRNTVDEDMYLGLVEKRNVSDTILKFLAGQLRSRHEVDGNRPRNGRNRLGRVANAEKDHAK